MMVAIATQNLPLPFVPESLVRLKARLAAALAPVYDVARCEADPSVRLSRKQEHYFDFADGVRLIVSRDTLATETVAYVHVSGSFRHGSLFERGILSIPEGMGQMRVVAYIGGIMQHFRDLVGFAASPCHQLISDGYVVHLFYTQDEIINHKSEISETPAGGPPDAERSAAPGQGLPPASPPAQSGSPGRDNERGNVQ